MLSEAGIPCYIWLGMSSLTQTTRLLLLVLALGSSSFACTCPGFGPACAEVVRPDVSAVFFGTVESIEVPQAGQSYDGREMSANLGGGVVEVLFRVREVFKGVSSSTLSVRTNRSEAACGFPFQEAESYLVYATEHAGKLYTSICQRTRPERLAAEDLAYLRRIQDMANDALIFGTYKRYTYDPTFVPKFTPSIMDHYRPPEEEYRAMAPMTGETITIIGETGKQWETQIDENGQFLIRGLPPGKYRFRATAPPKLAPPFGHAEGGVMRGPGLLQVGPKGCAEITFRTEPDGHIAGRILDTNGHPLSNTEVRVWNAQEEFHFNTGYSYQQTNSDGTFDVGPMPPGEYIVAAFVWVLPQGLPSKPEDQERLTEATLRFYPDTPDHHAATPIVLDLGQHVSNVELRIHFDPDAWKNVNPIVWH